MGCTDERSVSSKSQKKRNRNLSGSETNKIPDKKGPLNSQDKLNPNEDDVKKYDHSNKKKSSDRKLNIGYLSSDCWDHVMMKYINPILKVDSKGQSSNQGVNIYNLKKSGS